MYAVKHPTRLECSVNYKLCIHADAVAFTLGIEFDLQLSFADDKKFTRVLHAGFGL